MRQPGLTKNRNSVDESYLDLIKEFRLRPIQTAEEHVAAQAILDRLIGRPDWTGGQIDYLAGLARFVEDYEQEHYAAQFPKLSPIEILKHLLEENDMTTSDLGQVLGSRGLASEVLNGKRGLSKALIRKLADRFAVDAALFLK